MTHLENYQYEVYVPAHERAWLQWATNVEMMLGHSIDGDQEENGYSLDVAYSWFKKGSSDRAYVDAVRAKRQYKK